MDDETPSADDVGRAAPTARTPDGVERDRLRPLYLASVVTIETAVGPRAYRAVTPWDGAPDADARPLAADAPPLPDDVARVVVLTAHNPVGPPVAATVAVARTRRLRTELERLADGWPDLRVWDAVGAAPPGAPPWREPSVAVAGLDDALAHRLALTHGQRAWFELTPTHLRVCWTSDA